MRARIAAALVAGALAAACTDPHTRPPYEGAGHTTPVRGGNLRYAFDSDIRTLDPHLAYDEISGAAVRLLFDTLVDYAPGTTTLVGSLAERWEASPDGRTYTFHLRSGLRFHNGRSLSADDVKKSFERMTDPDRVPCPGTSFYHLLDGFDAFQSHTAAHLAGVTVIDPATVQFHLTAADQTFLNALAMPFAAPVPVEEVARMGNDAFAQSPVGAGPFRIRTWEMGSRLVLERAPMHWDPTAAPLDTITIETGIASHLQFMRFQRGEIDYMYASSMTTADYLWLKSQPAWMPYVHEDADISMYGLAMNTELAPFDNVHVRRAVAAAIDRDAIARSKNYRSRPIAGIYPPGLPGNDPHLPGGQHYDVALAQHEMALAGHPDGIPAEVDFWLTQGGSSSSFGQLIQADLARIGIHVRLRLVSFSTFLENTERRGAVQMSWAGWSQDFPDPSNFVETLFHSRNISAEGAQNQSFYHNPALDSLLDAARVDPDPVHRLAQYRRAEQIVVADAPWAFCFYPLATEVVQPYVKNYRMNPVFSHDLRHVWLDLPLHATSH